MPLAKALNDSVSLFHDEFEWIRSIDYEHVPFRCRKCHEHGHIFSDFPLNTPPKTTPTSKSKDAKGFTKVPSWKKHTKKSSATPQAPNIPSTSNNFEILATHPTLKGNPSQPSSDSPISDILDLKFKPQNTPMSLSPSIPHTSTPWLTRTKLSLLEVLRWI